MGGRPGVRELVIASLVCAGCNGVAERPGHDFSVRVLDEEPIEAVGRIYVQVPFAVDGCDAFDVTVEIESGVSGPVGLTAAADGTFVASVPVAWMQDQSRCGGDFLDAMYRHRPGTLVTVCHDAERSARAAFAVRSPSEGRYSGSDHGEIRAVFRGDRPGVPSWIATSEFSAEAFLYGFAPGRLLRGEWAPALNPAAYLNPLVRPRMARSGDHAFVTLGCETRPDCPPVSIGPGESVPGERLADIVLSDGWAAPPRGIARVSTNVIDMAYAPDGALVVVSDSSIARTWIPNDDTARWGETIVWRVTPAPAGSQAVVENTAEVIARFPRETVVTRLSRTATGSLAFVTVANPGSVGLAANLRVTDGTTVTTSYTASCPVGRMYGAECFNALVDSARTFVSAGVHLSPDASSMVVVQPESGERELLYWIDTGSADRTWQPFGHRDYPRPVSSVQRQLLYYSHGNEGAAWLPDAVALWVGGDIVYPNTFTPDLVQVFEATPPRVLRYEYEVAALPGASTDPSLLGVIAVGDHLVLTTRTGVRILDALGTLVGGTDPLPCGATVTATAEQLGPTTVAVGVGHTVVLFEVGAEGAP